MGAGLPSTLVFGLAIDNATELNLFAATEAGPYRFDAHTQTWASILGTEAPLTGYWCVESVPELRVARFGTYGRGIWDYAIRNPAEVAEGAGSPGRGLALSIAPNPARDRAAVLFDLPAAARVHAELFDVSGRRLARLVDRELPAGPQKIDFDLVVEGGGPLLAGTYFVRVRAPGAVAVEKIQVVR
jgi:hypothetical protein